MKIAFVLMMTGLPIQSFASTMTLENEKSAVKFSAVGRPSLLNIKGEATGIDGALHQTGGDVVGDLTFNLDKLQTGIETRDHHMKEKYLETKTFPKSEFIIETVHLPESFLKSTTFSQKAIPVKGNLSLHGVKKDVAGTLDLTRNKETFDGIVHLPIKLSDFKINAPKFAGIEVKDDVDVEVDVKGLIQ